MTIVKLTDSQDEVFHKACAPEGAALVEIPESTFSKEDEDICTGCGGPLLGAVVVEDDEPNLEDEKDASA